VAKIRNYPLPIPGALGQPVRMRFESDDRIILPGKDCDWRPSKTTDAGHVLQAAHDPVVTCAISHADMAVQAGKAGFRHDRHWYSTTAMVVRLRADVSDILELSYEERQRIMWKESFILEFLRLEKCYPRTVSRGDDAIEKAIKRVDKILRLRQSQTADNGRRKRSGRVKMSFDPPGPKALRTWIKTYDAADRDPLSLRENTHRSGNRDERLTDEQIELIGEFAPRFLSRNKPSINGLREAIKAKIVKTLNPERAKKRLDPIPVPSWGRLKREIDEMGHFAKLAGREGPEDAIRQAAAYGDGVTDLARALQEVEIDHWTVGLRTLLTKAKIWHRLNRASRRNLKKVRMTLGAAKCRRTHVIVGMTLSRTASVESAVRLIEMAVSDKKRFASAAGCITPYDIHGVMERILFDGGPAFNNGEVRGTLRDLKIDWDIPPGGLPHLRGMIERFFRTVDDQVISWFEGRTFSDVVAKGDYDPDERAGTSVEELGRVLVRYVVDRHHNTPMIALAGATPREEYMDLTKKFGVWPSPDPTKMRNVFGITIKRVLGPGGIRFLNVRYRSRALHEHFLQVGPVEVSCKVHPANLGAISVKIGKKWFAVRGPKELDRVDAETWIAAEASIRKRMKTTEKTITGPIIAAAILDIERVAAAGREFAHIEDSPMQRSALLTAEAKMRVFADFPDEHDENAPEPPEDIYQDAIPVAGPAPSRRTKADKPAKARRRPQKATQARKVAKPAKKAASSARKAAKPQKPAKAPVKPSRAPKRAQGRRPGLRRGWSAKD
jgi:putative transposase